MSRHECKQCGAPIESYVSSGGGTYPECSETFGSGSHEFVIRELRGRIDSLEARVAEPKGEAEGAAQTSLGGLVDRVVELEILNALFGLCGREGCRHPICTIGREIRTIVAQSEGAAGVSGPRG